MTTPNAPTTPTEEAPLVIRPIARSRQSKTTEVITNAPAKQVVVIESKEQYDTFLVDAGEKYVMIEFFAAWCSPCKLIGMRLEELAEKYAAKLVIGKIDVDTMEELAMDNEVTTMPAFMILRNSKKLEQFSGSKVEMVESKLEEYMKK